MDNKKTYEGMFLVDAGNPDFNAASEPVRNILTRYEAEMLAFKPWDERRLAYEILGRKRGLYILCYFKLDPLKVHEVEHDCRLDERVSGADPPPRPPDPRADQRRHARHHAALGAAGAAGRIP